MIQQPKSPDSPGQLIGSSEAHRRTACATPRRRATASVAAGQHRVLTTVLGHGAFNSGSIFFGMALYPSNSG